MPPPRKYAKRLGRRQYDPSGNVAKPPQVLSPALLRFCDEFTLDLNPEDAAYRAGFEPVYGRRILSYPIVQDRIAALKAQRATRMQISQDHVLRAWEAARQVDYNEFVELRVTCCRYCWGMDHRYQFTAEELRAGRQAHLSAQLRKPLEDRVEFDDQGGDGFDRLRQPCFSAERAPILGFLAEHATGDHDCPECSGGGEALLSGKPMVIFKDTRFLAQAARYIYQGVEVTANGGMKYNLRGRKEFDDLVARHLGMFPKEGRRPLNLEEMSVDELTQFLEANGTTVDVVIENEPADYHGPLDVPGAVALGGPPEAGGDGGGETSGAPQDPALG